MVEELDRFPPIRRNVDHDRQRLRNRQLQQCGDRRQPDFTVSVLELDSMLGLGPCSFDVTCGQLRDAWHRESSANPRDPPKTADPR